MPTVRRWAGARRPDRFRFPGPPRDSGLPVGSAVGSPIVEPALDPDPTTEYVTAGHAVVNVVLNRSIDDVTRRYGVDLVYDLVHTDPAAGAALTSLERAIFAKRFQVLIPRAVRPPAGMDPAADPAAARAEEIRSYAERLMGGMEEPAEEVGRQMFVQAARHGAEIGEIVLDFGDEAGPDALRYVCTRIKVKPRKSWAFVVDAFLNVIGYFCRTTEGFRTIEPWKFLRLTWMPENGDPRGTSIYRRVFQFWQLKIQALPEYLTYLIKYATPFLLGTAAEKSQARVPLDPSGRPIPGKLPVPPEVALANMLARARGTRVATVPFGAKVEVVESKSQGEPHQRAIDLFDRQITLAILCETRATIESKYGSRADSESAMDILGMIVITCKNIICRMFQFGLVYPLVALNFGKADADRYCPELSLGEVEHQDLAKLLSALANVGYRVTPSQGAFLDGLVNFQARLPEEVGAPIEVPAATGNSPGNDTTNPPVKPAAPAGQARRIPFLRRLAARRRRVA